MSQYDFGTIDPATKSGTALANDLNNWRDAVHSSHIGAARPAYVKAGMIWVDVSAAPVCYVKLFDGTNDIPIATFNNTSHTGGAIASAAGVTFAPIGTIAANNVQAALQELDTEKAALSGAGFTGDIAVQHAGTSTVRVTSGTGAASGLHTIIASSAASTQLSLSRDAGAAQNVLSMTMAGAALQSIMVGVPGANINFGESTYVGNANKGYFFDADTGVKSSSDGTIQVLCNNTSVIGITATGVGINGTLGGDWSQSTLQLNSTAAGGASIGFNDGSTSTAGKLNYKNGIFKFFGANGVSLSTFVAGPLVMAARDAQPDLSNPITFEASSYGVISEQYGQHVPGVKLVHNLRVGTNTFTFENGGNAYAPGSWVDTSDIRIKSDVQKIDPATAAEKFKRLNGYTFKKEGTGDKELAGTIAQEWLQEFPQCVHGSGEEGDYYGVSAAAQVGVMVAVIQDLFGRLEAAEQKIAKLAS